MKLAIIGMGVMGRNLALNFRDAGHQCVTWDPWPQARTWTAEGIEVCDTLEALVNSLPVPSIVLLMVKSGRPVFELTEKLTGLLEKGDVIIDGGNSNYLDTETNVITCREHGINFAGLGVSGGAEGARSGPSMMLGCAAEMRIMLEPLLANVAARHDGKSCLGWFGEGGAGHFVKMVHNGIEYGMMAAIAEGMAILEAADAGTEERQIDAETSPLRSPQYYQYDFDTAAVAEVWRRGSVISSWLVDLTAHAMSKDANLDGFAGRVSDSGEGRWTAQAAVDLGVPAHTITASLFERFASRNNDEFANKVLSAMRSEFGGHNEKAED